ncbi:unnamed protein product, partial [Urochloa humidicola]
PLRLPFPRARLPFPHYSSSRAQDFPPQICRQSPGSKSPGHHVAAAVVTMFQSSCPLGAQTVEIHLVGSAPARHRQLPVGIEEAGARHGQGMEFGWDMSQARSGLEQSSEHPMPARDQPARQRAKGDDR